MGSVHITDEMLRAKIAAGKARKKSKGWVKESGRHSAAARGIKTARQSLLTFKRGLKGDELRLAAVEKALDAISEFEGTISARGIVTIKIDTLEWPLEWTIDGKTFKLTNVSRAHHSVDDHAKDIRAGKTRRPADTDVRVAFAAGGDLDRPYAGDRVGGYPSGQWALYER